MPATTSSQTHRASNYWQQTVQNRMLLIVLGMVVLVPVLALPSNQAMQSAANYALRVMAGLLAGVLVLRARVATGVRDVETFLGTGANLAVLLYLLDSALALLLTPADLRRLGAIDFMRIVTGTLLYFALAYHIRRSEHLVKIQDALVMVAVMMSIFGLSSMAMQAGKARMSILGDHQLYGALLMILFPVTIVAALTEKDNKRRIAAQIAAALTGVSLVLAQTRTSWVGAGVEIAALMVFSRITPPRRGDRPPANKAQYVIPVLIILACAILFAVMGGARDTLIERMNAENRREALDYRARMSYAATEMIKEKPVFGNGLGMFAIKQESYSKYGRTADKMTASPPSLGEMAHNFWLQTAAEQGVIGACLFGAILITFLVAGVRRLRFLDSGIRRWLLIASLASALGFAVDAIGNPAWQFAQIAMFLWLILGLGVACLRPRNPRADH